MPTIIPFLPASRSAELDQHFFASLERIAEEIARNHPNATSDELKACILQVCDELDQESERRGRLLGIDFQEARFQILEDSLVEIR